MSAYVARQDVEAPSPMRSTPTRNKWREALSWAIVHLSRGLDGHYVRKGETWDTALLRVAAGHLSMQGYRLPIVDVAVSREPGPWLSNAEKVKAVMDRELFTDLQTVATADVPASDGKVQGPHGRINAPRRRGWRV